MKITINQIITDSVEKVLKTRFLNKKVSEVIRPKYCKNIKDYEIVDVEVFIDSVFNIDRLYECDGYDEFTITFKLSKLDKNEKRAMIIEQFKVDMFLKHFDSVI
jgi:hypothetical protein